MVIDLLLIAWVCYEGIRLWRTRPQSRIVDLLLARQYRLSTAAMLIGLANGGLYLIYGAWGYTGTLHQTAEAALFGRDQPSPQRWFLFAAMLLGMVLSTWQRGSLRVDWRPQFAWARNFVGGLLMGLGAALIPGGNDALVLYGIPSLSPHAMMGSRDGYRMGDAKLVDTMIVDGLWDVFNQYHMGVTAENVAKEYAVTREEQDEFAVKSQNKTEAAQKAGRFKDEITPVTIKSRKGDVIVADDEYPRHGATLDAMTKLKPVFAKDGTVTAGNASGLNDGAAAVLMIPNRLLIKVSVLSQVLNGVLLPPVLIYMLLLINKRDLMGKYVNGRFFNVIAWVTTAIVIALTVTYAIVGQ